MDNQLCPKLNNVQEKLAQICYVCSEKATSD